MANSSLPIVDLGYTLQQAFSANVGLTVLVITQPVLISGNVGDRSILQLLQYCLRTTPYRSITLYQPKSPSS